MLTRENIFGDMLELLELKLGTHICTGRKEVLADAKLPILEGIKKYLHIEEGSITWLERVGKDLNEEIRELLISGVKGEMSAFGLYIDCDFWTEKEDILLKSKFEGKLPKAEKELKDGVISRIKQ